MIVRTLLAFAAAVMAMAAAPGALAQAASTGPGSWPSRPIRWIVPFPPGGPSDLVSRVVASKLSERVSQPVIVENRPGAAGNIGAEAVAKASPDGHTILLTTPTVITNPSFFKASVDPNDLASVILLNRLSLVLLTHPSFPAKSVAEIIAQVKANPGAVSCGYSGFVMVGCELVRVHAQAPMIMVQYKGNAPALTALVGGEINILFDLVNTAIAQVKAGRVRAIASANPVRGSGIFADLPTVAETIPNFDLVAWQGLAAPRATPREVILRMNREIGAVLELPDVRQRFSDSGVEVAGGTADAFDQFFRREYAKFSKVLGDAGISPK